MTRLANTFVALLVVSSFFNAALAQNSNGGLPEISDVLLEDIATLKSRAEVFAGDFKSIAKDKGWGSGSTEYATFKSQYENVTVRLQNVVYKVGWRIVEGHNVAYSSDMRAEIASTQRELDKLEREINRLSPGFALELLELAKDLAKKLFEEVVKAIKGSSQNRQEQLTLRRLEMAKMIHDRFQFKSFEEVKVIK